MVSHHDMRAAPQKRRAVTHRFGDKTAQWRDGFFDRRPSDDAVRHVFWTARLEFFPKTVVRPVFEPGVEIALDVVAAEHRIALRGERKAAAVIAIANLRIGRRLRHDAEPAERIALLVGLR